MRFWDALSLPDARIGVVLALALLLVLFEQPDGKRVRTEWRTPVSGWQDVAGRKLPTRAEAVWQLPTGPFSYADFSVDPALIAFNVAPL